MDIVINASPLIILSKINQLHLLNKLFETVYIPSAVLQEIQAIDNAKEKVNISEIAFKRLEVTNRVAVLGLLGRLHLVEVEVIIGAIEKGIATVVLDENAARNKAKQLGLDVTGTLGILLRANKNGLIADMEQEILNLENAGMYLSEELMTRIIASIHE